MLHHHLPHLSDARSRAATPSAITSTPLSSSEAKRGKKRGNYNCGRCGLPKKGHSCEIVSTSPAECSESGVTAVSGPFSLSSACPLPSRQPFSNLRRALSFEDADDVQCGFQSDHGDADEIGALSEDPEMDLCSGGLPASCRWEVLRRLPPAGLLSAARVCKGWRETTKKLWREAEALRLKIPNRAQIGFVASILQKCSGLVNLSLRMESDVDATMLDCIAFSCPNLEVMEIYTSNSSINRITGDELGRFVADKRCLKNIKMEGCSNLDGFILSSSSICKLWLSDLHSLSKMAFNFPNLKELFLEFSQQENESTDFTAMADSIGRSCPKLQNIHIASFRLSHAFVLALTAAQLRELRRLSLVLGIEITDASVAAIASSYPELELLDLSGSSISDSGIGMICNVYSETMCRLLLALCPNVTSSGIQFATAQLPHLELMDCGMTICDPDSQSSIFDSIDDYEVQKTPNSKIHLIHQKLIIKHSQLKKLSLWGCSGLDALYLNCPMLDDLNLNSCKNLQAERLLLQCPNLASIHVADCDELLVGAVRSQVSSNLSPMGNLLSFRRSCDGSKRIRVPDSIGAESCDEEKKSINRMCNVIAN